MRNHASSLSAAARGALRRLDPAVRHGLPAFVNGAVVCPLLEPTSHAARSLVADRFAAAVGLVPDEATLNRMAC